MGFIFSKFSKLGSGAKTPPSQWLRGTNFSNPPTPFGLATPLIRSFLSILCRFAFFIAQVSVSCVNALFTKTLYIFPFMWYDAPLAVGIGDNSLNFAHTHLTPDSCCFLHSSRLKCVAQIAELRNTFQLHIGLNHNFFQQNWLKEAILTLQAPPTMEINITLQLSGNATTTPLLKHPHT